MRAARHKADVACVIPFCAVLVRIVKVGRADEMSQLVSEYADCLQGGRLCVFADTHKARPDLHPVQGDWHAAGIMTPDAEGELMNRACGACRTFISAADENYRKLVIGKFSVLIFIEF